MSPNLETSRYLSIFSWLSEGSVRAALAPRQHLFGLPAIFRAN